MHHRQTERTRQADALGTAIDHRLGADVDGDTPDGLAPDLAAGSVRRLQDDHLVAGSDEVAGRGQAGDTGSDDDRPQGLPLTHGFTLRAVICSSTRASRGCDQSRSTSQIASLTDNVMSPSTGTS